MSKPLMPAFPRRCSARNTVNLTVIETGPRPAIQLKPLRWGRVIRAAVNAAVNDCDAPPPSAPGVRRAA